MRFQLPGHGDRKSNFGEHKHNIFFRPVHGNHEIHKSVEDTGITALTGSQIGECKLWLQQRRVGREVRASGVALSRAVTTHSALVLAGDRRQRGGAPTAIHRLHRRPNSPNRLDLRVRRVATFTHSSVDSGYKALPVL